MTTMDTKSMIPKWDWIPCNYTLKTEVKKKQETWSLAAQVLLTSPIEEQPDPIVKLYIDTEKSLQYSDELGWNWHKSWNLPNISVRLEIKDAESNDTLLCPRNIFAHMFAVKAVIDQQDNFHLVDVGMRGNNKLELVNGQAFFSAIKFFSTSYNNEGVKFHLVLAIYIMNDDDDTPKVLTATISPPIFVDSRKSARDAQILLDKKISSYVEPFLPENLDKIFIKRENKKKNDTEIKIFNDSEGLYNYLTAPNIRHKVKHPLFLALKFSSCVELFFNKSQMVNEDGTPIPEDQFLETLQRNLSRDHHEQTQKVTKVLGDRMFILYLEENQDNQKQKKIVEAVESLDCPSLGIIYKLDDLPPLFENLCGENSKRVEETIALFKKKYQVLQQIAKQIRTQRELMDAQEEQDYSDEPDDDDDDGPAVNYQEENIKKQIKKNPNTYEDEKNVVLKQQNGGHEKSEPVTNTHTLNTHDAIEQNTQVSRPNIKSTLEKLQHHQSQQPIIQRDQEPHQLLQPQQVQQQYIPNTQIPEQQTIPQHQQQFQQYPQIPIKTTTIIQSNNLEGTLQQQQQQPADYVSSEQGKMQDKSAPNKIVQPKPSHQTQPLDSLKQAPTQSQQQPHQSGGIKKQAPNVSEKQMQPFPSIQALEQQQLQSQQTQQQQPPQQMQPLQQPGMMFNPQNSFMQHQNQKGFIPQIPNMQPSIPPQMQGQFGGMIPQDPHQQIPTQQDLNMQQQTPQQMIPQQNPQFPGMMQQQRPPYNPQFQQFGMYDFPQNPQMMIPQQQYLPQMQNPQQQFNPQQPQQNQQQSQQQPSQQPQIQQPQQGQQPQFNMMNNPSQQPNMQYMQPYQMVSNLQNQSQFGLPNQQYPPQFNHWQGNMMMPNQQIPQQSQQHLPNIQSENEPK